MKNRSPFKNHKTEKITGYVGNELVIAWLNHMIPHYSYKGKMYCGTVQFTRIVKSEK